jgi:hypothetical protein
MVLRIGGRPTLVSSLALVMDNLKEFGHSRLLHPKKIEPFNIAYVNFHCRGRDRLLECFMVEGAVP